MVSFMLPYGGSTQVDEYIDAAGRSPFGRWVDELNSPAAAAVNNRLERLSNGNRSNVKSVGAGVFEIRIDFGPGYRVYFGKDGEGLILLLAGGTKARQQRDIEAAQARWSDYKARKKRMRNATQQKF